MRVKHNRVTIKAVRAAIKLHDALADHATMAATAYPWWRRTDRADARAVAGRERAVADALRGLVGGWGVIRCPCCDTPVTSNDRTDACPTCNQMRCVHCDKMGELCPRCKGNQPGPAPEERTQ